MNWRDKFSRIISSPGVAGAGVQDFYDLRQVEGLSFAGAGFFSALERLKMNMQIVRISMGIPMPRSLLCILPVCGLDESRASNVTVFLNALHSPNGLKPFSSCCLKKPASFVTKVWLPRITGELTGKTGCQPTLK